MRICHVTSAHNTKDVRILKKECVSLAQNNDYKVFLVGKGDTFEYENVHVIGLGDPPRGRLKRMTGFAARIVDAALKLDADMYHLHDPELLRFALKIKQQGKKVIFDSHENVLDSIDDKTYWPVVIRKIFKNYYKWLQCRVLPKINGIIVVSPQMVTSYSKYNKNVTLVTNYPIIKGRDNWDTNEYIKKGRFIFAGGISEQWSHREFINAIEHIDGVEYYLFGPADELYLNELKQLNGWKKVHYGGIVPFETVQEELERAQFAVALLKPSKNTFYEEGTMGNTKLFEAMEKGKPVLATDFKLWKPIIEGHNCGVCINPNNQEAIKNAVIGCMDLDNSQYIGMQKECRDAVCNCYNWDNAEKQLLLFYKKIMELNS